VAPLSNSKENVLVAAAMSFKRPPQIKQAALANFEPGLLYENPECRRWAVNNVCTDGYVQLSKDEMPIRYSE
jgi:hypothetical protein